MIANFEVQKIIIGSGSVEIKLLFDAFKMMKLPKERLMTIKNLLYGFNGEADILERVITLPMTLGI